MSVKKLKKLAEEAFLLLPVKSLFVGFVRACLVLGIDVLPRDSSNGVVVRTGKFLVQRYRNADGLVVSTVSEIPH